MLYNVNNMLSLCVPAFHQFCETHRGSSRRDIKSQFVVFVTSTE